MKWRMCALPNAVYMDVYHYAQRPLPRRPGPLAAAAPAGRGPRRRGSGGLGAQAPSLTVLGPPQLSHCVDC